MTTKGASHTEGTLRPNLVVEFDNEYRFQFRVQCEVRLLDERQAMNLVEQLKSNDPDQLARAQDTVVQIAKATGTTLISQKIIDAAFRACIEYLKGPHDEGTLRPNLVVVFDNEYRFQFRVQCEVKPLVEGQALDLIKQLRSNDPVKLAEAQGTLLQIARDHGASQRSQKIIGAAFEACIKHFQEHPSPPPH